MNVQSQKSCKDLEEFLEVLRQAEFLRDFFVKELIELGRTGLKLQL